MNPAMRRRLWLALRIALYALLVMGGLALAQDSLLYFPEKTTPAQMQSQAHAAGLAPWPTATGYRGLLREPPAAAGPVRATVVLFHGNAGHAAHRAWYAEQLAALGLRVILAEYPAYGAREGKLGEVSLVADARETVALARKQFAEPLIVAGESLGAGVAAAAQAGADATAVLLITPWDTLQNVASHHYPWFPVSWLLRDRYDSGANLARFRGRVAVVVADDDAIVPARFGRALYEGLPQTKRLFPVAAAGHNDWMTRVDGKWWRDLLGFLLPRPG